MLVIMAINVSQCFSQFNCTIGSTILGKPHDITFNSNNQLLIADHDHHCIYIFTLNGDYVGKFGTRGSDMGQFNSPFGISIDLYDNVLVADFWNHRVSIYNEDGDLIHCFGSEGSSLYPYGAAVSPDGSIYVTNHDNKKIQIFSC